MNEHIQSLLAQREYSDEFKEEAAIRVLFPGQDPSEVAECMEIPNLHTLKHWVNAYRRKIDDGLITLSPMTEKQKQDLQALQQRNKELERAVKDAYLMILALNNLIDVAEKDLKIPIRKKRGTKRS